MREPRRTAPILRELRRGRACGSRSTTSARATRRCRGCASCPSDSLKIDRAFLRERARRPEARRDASPRSSSSPRRARAGGGRRGRRDRGPARVPRRPRLPARAGLPPRPPRARPAELDAHLGLVTASRLTRAGTLSPSWTSPSTSAGSSRSSCRTGAPGEVLTLAYANAEALAAHARDRRAAPVEPLARRAVAQGRDVGQHAGRPGAAPRLRRRRAARARRARRARPATPASAPASTTASSSRPRRTRRCPRSSARSPQRAAERPEGSYTVELLDDPRAASARR